MRIRNYILIIFTFTPCSRTVEHCDLHPWFCHWTCSLSTRIGSSREGVGGYRSRGNVFVLLLLLHLNATAPLFFYHSSPFFRFLFLILSPYWNSVSFFSYFTSNCHFTYSVGHKITSQLLPFLISQAKFGGPWVDSMTFCFDFAILHITCYNILFNNKK